MIEPGGTRSSVFRGGLTDGSGPIAQNNQRNSIASHLAVNGAPHLFDTLGYKRHRFSADAIYVVPLAGWKIVAGLEREVTVSATVRVRAQQ